MTPLRCGVAAWMLLIALQPVWYLWLAPPAAGHAWVALLLTLPPLLLPALALRGGVRRALLRAGIVALFYFCHGVVATWVYPSARLPALLEVLLCVVLIAAIGVDVRQARRG